MELNDIKMYTKNIFTTAVVLLSNYFVVTSTGSLTPTFIRPCTELSPTCLMRAIQDAIPGFVAGVPELGLDTLDPLLVHELKLSLNGELHINFLNGTAKGFRKCIVDSASLVSDELRIKFHCNLTIKGQYKSYGRLLVFAINGEGDSIIRCKNISIGLNLKLGSELNSDGKKHIEIRSYDIKHSFDGIVTYQMTNLFRGNPHISKVVLDFMNRNWRMIAEEFGTPIVDFGVKTIMKRLRRFFQVVPLEDLIYAPVHF